ncbi:MAG: MBL fold metallo-hydrolase [Clostridia bacterium]|nr:MBL fold metallo-hydrolase [Clostridia bacterium]
MTKKGYLIGKYYELMDSKKESKIAFYTNPANARLESFQIADQLYYVGDKKVCIHLIDTGEGLILLDSGYFGTTHLLVDSIFRAGFDPADVRWIIHSHGHHDHYGASEEFRTMYGTKLAISKVDAESLRKYPHRSAIDTSEYPFAKTPEFDYEIEDGEIFELGNIKIRCVLTPGHTDGVLSFFFDVTYEGKTYLAGMLGGAGVNALTLPYVYYNERTEDPAHQMLGSIEKIWNEPVVVHLGNHPGNNKTLQKREKKLAEGGNPFIAPDSWQSFLTELRAKAEKIIIDNKKLDEEVSAIVCD